MFSVSRFIVAASLLLFAATPGFAANVTVTANSNLTFSPATVTINAGDTVTFKNTGGQHNVVADDGSFCCTSSCVSGSTCGTSGANWSSTVTFSNAGTFGFYCAAHGDPGGFGMAGKVIVNSVTTTPPPIGPSTSGAWYNTNQSGSGFLINVLPNNVFLAVWFVFTPDGTAQSWIYAQGNYDPTSNSVTLSGSGVFVEGGTAFPPNFDKTKVTRTPWGSFTFTFSDCNTGSVHWDSSLPGYGSSTMAITRLTGLAGLACGP